MDFSDLNDVEDVDDLIVDYVLLRIKQVGQDSHAALRLS